MALILIAELLANR